MKMFRFAISSSLAVAALFAASAAFALCPGDLPPNGGCGDLTWEVEKTTADEYDYIAGSGRPTKSLTEYLEIFVQDDWKLCSTGPRGQVVDSVKINLKKSDTDSANVSVGYELAVKEQAEANVELIGKVGISSEQKFSAGLSLTTTVTREIGKEYNVNHFGCTKGSVKHSLYGKKDATAKGDAVKKYKWHDRCRRWWYAPSWGPEHSCTTGRKDVDLTAPTGCATFNRIDAIDDPKKSGCTAAELSGDCAPKPVACTSGTTGMDGLTVVCIDETTGGSDGGTSGPTGPTAPTTDAGPIAPAL